MGALFPMKSLFQALTAVAIIVVTGCSNTSDELDQISSVLRPGQQQPVARSVPLLSANAPQLLVAFPKIESLGVMLLEGRRDGVETWLSAEGATLTLQRGMLRSSRGLGQGLLASEISQSVDMVFAGRAGTVHRFHTYLNGNNETETRTYVCQIEDRGIHTVVIGGMSMDTRLMAEDCQNLDQQFLNLYWVSRANNQIVQSRQWLGDLVGVVSTRVIPQ